MSDLKDIGALAAQYGPLVTVIGLLLRSNWNKDRIIEEMNSQLLQTVVAAKQMAEASKKTVDLAMDTNGKPKG